VWRTEAARGKIGGHHDRGAALLELAHDPVALVLVLVAMDGKGRYALCAAGACQLVAGALRVAEDKNLSIGLAHARLKKLEESGSQRSR